MPTTGRLTTRYDARSLPSQGRKTRKPQHSFYVRSSAFGIQPFFIAPVLPGETMRSLLLQSRAVSDPIKNKLTGWWLEYYFFYVKLRDLNERVTLTEMLIDPTDDLASLNEAADTQHHHLGSAPNFVRLCLQRVVEEYFRNEGEAWNIVMHGSNPAAQVNNTSWIDSLIRDADYVRPDVNVDLNANATILASEVDEALRRYQWMRANGITDMSYEEYIAQHGIRMPEEEQHVPELIRYVREWTYPTNTVEPTTGVPSSAVVWSIQERADKDRFFREPGFLFGVTVARPKVYLGRMRGNMVDYLNTAVNWLPVMMSDDPHTRMKKFAALSGPIPDSTVDYWVDVADLFLYGDQFTSFATTVADGTVNVVDLPATGGTNKKYVSLADADALFTGASGRVRQDGVVSLTIAGTVIDLTAPT
jgi:hypothetical protein